ncbi:hypothetical protein I4U23_000452 [Adineta vaga]|nr:hypothetical protein I4U23_000452 [Adineta vaga]
MSLYLQQSIQVSCRGMIKSITNLTHVTTVADIIHALLENLSENDYYSINDCCLYLEQQPYLYPLKTTDFIHEILSRYSSMDVHFKLAFKRNSSPSRLAQRKQLVRTSIIDPYERLRTQELLIQKQQEIINQLTKTNDENRISPSNRQSRQEEYYQAVNNHEDTTRSLSRVRFRMTKIDRESHVLSPSSSIIEIKSILKKSPIQRSSSVDRDIDQLIALKPDEDSFCKFNDDDNLSDKSATDSCLGSLSSEDGVYHCQPFETLQSSVLAAAVVLFGLIPGFLEFHSYAKALEEEEEVMMTEPDTSASSEVRAHLNR